MKGKMQINGVIIADKDGEDLLTKIAKLQDNQVLLNELLFRDWQVRNDTVWNKIKRFFNQKVY